MDRRWTLAVATGLALVVGCTAAPPVGPSSLPPTSPAAPVATPTGPASPAVAGRPPDATLSAEGGDAATGQLGTYTWAGAGSDSPWLPGTPIAVGAGEPLTVRIAGDLPVESWAARRTPGGATSDVGAIPVASGAAVIAFAAPPAGDWTVELQVRFVGGGSASYAWRLAVS